MLVAAFFAGPTCNRHVAFYAAVAYDEYLSAGGAPDVAVFYYTMATHTIVFVFWVRVIRAFKFEVLCMRILIPTDVNKLILNVTEI